MLVPVIDLAKTMKEQHLGDADTDILQAHLNAKHTADAPLLLQLRLERRLVVLLDGMDEAGDCRETLERYVSCRLATEVQLCVTGREQGIKSMQLFGFFTLTVPRAGQSGVGVGRVRSPSGLAAGARG